MIPQGLRGWLGQWGPATLICLTGLVIRGYFAFSGYYWQDDYRYLASARVMPFGLDYLLQDISGNGHLMPATFVVAWLATRIDAAPHPVVASVTVVLQGVVLAAMAWVLRQWSRSPWALVALTALAFTPLGLVGVSWWSFAMQGLSLQASLLIFIGALTAQHRDGGRRWSVIAVLALVCGLAFWEKALVVPVLGVFSVACFVAATNGRAVFVEWLRRNWRLGVALGVVMSTYFVVYLNRSSALPTTAASADWREVALNALPRTLLPGLFGGPWTAAGNEQTLMPLPSLWVQWLSVLGASGIVVLSLWRGGWRAGIAWLPIVAVLGGDILLVVTQRSAWATTFMRDPRYFFDAIPLILVAVTVGLTVRRRVPQEAPDQAPNRAAAWQAAAFLALSSAITMSAVAPNHQHHFARSYVQTLQRATHDHPGLSLIDAPAPRLEVIFHQFSSVTTAFDLPVSFAATAGPVYTVDGFGKISTVSIPDPEARRQGPIPGCGWRVSAGKPLTIALPVRAGEHNRLVRVEYLLEDGQPALLSLGGLSGADELVQASEVSGAIHAQSRTPVGSLVVIVSEGGPICIPWVIVGEPWPSGQAQ